MNFLSVPLDSHKQSDRVCCYLWLLFASLASTFTRLSVVIYRREARLSIFIYTLTITAELPTPRQVRFIARILFGCPTSGQFALWWVWDRVNQSTDNSVELYWWRNTLIRIGRRENLNNSLKYLFFWPFSVPSTGAPLQVFETINLLTQTWNWESIKLENSNN